jgi:glutathione reductase (NADPH)
VTQRYDYLVLGGGSGGVASARRAAEHGARVALVEPGRLGGTCVNVGCVPKKVMWNAAAIAETLRGAPDYGFEPGMPALDWPTLRARRDAYVARLNDIYAGLLERAGVTLIRGCARFADAAGTVAVGEQRLHAAHTLIATGGHSIRPGIPGGGLGLDSDGFFALARQPRRVAVVGAGYIAVELAGVLAALGSEVHLFIRGQTVLRSFDELIQTELTAQMEAHGLRIVRGFTPAAAHEDGEGYALAGSDGTRHGGYDALIWAIGRAPNTRSLAPHVAGIACLPDDGIVTDEYQATSVRGIYAVGDVTGRAPLTPVAIAAGRRLADRLFGGQTGRHLRYDQIPTVVFSHPPVGTVGLTEAQARKRHGEAVRTYTTRFTDMYYALGEHRPATVAKLVCAGEDERVVGLHVLGRGADELTQGFAVALRMGARKRDLDETLAIHPTAAEELVLMR